MSSSDVREVELRLNDIRTRLNEANRQEQEAQRIKLENTIRFPASALIPDPLHNQIMAQISHNKVALMNQLRATEHHLQQIKELKFQMIQSQALPSESFDAPAMHQESFQSHIPRETVAPNHSSSPGVVGARPPFARPPFSAPNRMIRPPIELLHSHSNEHLDPKLELPRPAPVELIGNDRFIERHTVQSSADGYREQVQNLNRPRVPAPCDIKANVGRDPNNTNLLYVVKNPSMFNSRRFETEPEFRDWCIKYDIVAMKRKPDSPGKSFIEETPVVDNNNHHISRARTHLQTISPKSNSYPNRFDNHQLQQGHMSRYDSYNGAQGMPVRMGSNRITAEVLSEREIDYYDREYFDENHGPDPSHPYYSTWYNRFIKKPAYETRDHRPTRGHATEFKSSYRIEDERNKTEDRHDHFAGRRPGNRHHHHSIHKPPLPPSSPDNLRIEDVFRGSPSSRIDRDNENLNSLSCRTTPTPPPLPKEDAPPPPPMVPPPKVPEKPADVYQLDQMLSVPGRKEQQRLRNSLIIMRGPPGSGKSYIAKTIKDKEVSAGMTAPRVLSIDDYFMVTDESCKKGGMVYEYEEEMETVYLAALAKAMSKVVAEGSDRLVIIDACNSQVQHFQQFIDVAQKSLMKIYLVEMQTPLSVCLEQNIHKRSEDEIKKVLDNWEVAPAQFPRLDPAHFMSARQLAKDKETGGTSLSNDQGKKLTENRQASFDKSSIEPARKRRRSDSMELSDVEDDATTAPIMTNNVIAAKKPLCVQYYEPGEPTVSPVHSSHSFDESEETAIDCAAEKEQLPPSTTLLEEDLDGGGVSDHSSEEGSPPPPGCAFFPIKSKWENTDNSENALDRMDGFKSAHHGSTAGDKSTAQQQAPRESIEDFLSSCGDSYFERKSNSQSGKKRVRWADVEERREIEQEKRLGFIVGRTNWDRIVNDEDHMTATALTKTKFF